MLQTYSATLRNGQLEWGSKGPPSLPADVSVPVQITFMATTARSKSDGAAMAAVLEAIAARGGAPEFGEPVAWQIEERKDRPLPGRDE